MKKILILLLSLICVSSYGQNKGKKEIAHKHYKDSTVSTYVLDKNVINKMHFKNKKYRIKDTIYMTTKIDSTLCGKGKSFNFSEKKPKK
jgi:hypothetical protein